MLYTVAVNYGTPELITDWAKSIRQDNSDAFLLIVDNFESDEARAKAKEICRIENIELIESVNVGYGQGLDVGLSRLMQTTDIYGDDLVMFGNLDLSITARDLPNTSDPSAFMPVIRQGGRNRNPFLTKFQSRFVWLYDVVAKTRSPMVLTLAAGIIKVLGKVTSKPYATHGSLFVMNGAALHKIAHPIFNPLTFLYCEEMEFAEGLRQAGIPLVSCSVEVDHVGKVSTGAITRTKQDFINVWLSSWQNWRARWAND